MYVHHRDLSKNERQICVLNEWDYTRISVTLPEFRVVITCHGTIYMQCVIKGYTRMNGFTIRLSYIVHEKSHKTNKWEFIWH